MLRDHLGDIFGEGIFLADHDVWRFHRKTATNIFTTKLLRQLSLGTFTSSGLELAKVFDKYTARQEPVDFQDLFMRMTTDVFGKLSFGVDFGSLTASDEKSQYGEAFDYLTSSMDHRMLNPLWRWTDCFIPGRRQKLKDALDIVNGDAHKAIHARREELKLKKQERIDRGEEKEEESEEQQEKWHQQQGRPRDLLDHFITHVRDDGSMLSDSELRDVFVNFML